MGEGNTKAEKGGFMKRKEGKRSEMTRIDC